MERITALAMERKTKTSHVKRITVERKMKTSHAKRISEIIQKKQQRWIKFNSAIYILAKSSQSVQTFMTDQIQKYNGHRHNSFTKVQPIHWPTPVKSMYGEINLPEEEGVRRTEREVVNFDKPDDCTAKLGGTDRDGFIRVDDGYAPDPAKLLTSCNNFWDQAEAIARNIKFNRLSMEQRRHTTILITLLHKEDDSYTAS